MAHSVDPVCGHEGFNCRETRGERLHVVVQADENQSVPRLHAICGKAMGCPVDRLRRCERCSKQAPVLVVGPRMVWALNPPGVGALFHEQGAAVCAQVRQGGQVPRLVAQQEHGLVADHDRKLVTGRRKCIFRRREHPVAMPDAVLFRRQPCRIAVRGGGQRACRIQVDMPCSHVQLRDELPPGVPAAREMREEPSPSFIDDARQAQRALLYSAARSRPARSQGRSPKS